MKTATLLRGEGSAFLTWWLPLIAACVAAGGLRVVYIGRDLPVDTDPDTRNYHLWAKSIRNTGRPEGIDTWGGAGYPPGYLYLLIGSQLLVETIFGEDFDPATDYALAGRMISVVLGVGSVILLAWLAKSIGKSRLTGLAAAVVVALGEAYVGQSRRAAPNSAWLFFTLLAFVLLLQARAKRDLNLLNWALLMGVVSFLHKYQSGVMLILPFTYAIAYFRELGTKLHLHLLGWMVLLAVVLGWLLLDYEILSISSYNHDTASLHWSDRSGLFITLEDNWESLKEHVGGATVIWASVATFVIALVGLLTKLKLRRVDSDSVWPLALFCTLFYLLMSVFASVDVAKWLPVIVVVQLLAIVLLVQVLDWIAELVKQGGQPHAPMLSGLIPVGGVVLFGGMFVSTQWSHWRWTYDNIWTVPDSEVVLDAWFKEHVPQGARVVSEAHKLPFNYSYAPPAVHVYTVPSLLDESIEDYRARGYEYLIWNNLDSSFLGTIPDSIRDLDSEQYLTYLKNAEEVLRLAGEDVRGMGVNVERSSGIDIVVYKLDPLPEEEAYAWFGDVASFRGYDLPVEAMPAGSALALTLYWMGVQPTSADLMVFVHLWDEANQRLVAQHDGPPGQGDDPTWQWEGDMQFHPDLHSIPIPADSVPGVYEIRIGMYDTVTGERLSITPVGEAAVLQDSSLVLQTVTVIP